MRTAREHTEILPGLARRPCSEGLTGLNPLLGELTPSLGVCPVRREVCAIKKPRPRAILLLVGVINLANEVVQRWVNSITPIIGKK